jgi:quinol---cytochrome c reductase iron-sulfur subunit, bacillus type
MPEPAPGERFPRNKFLEFSTLGLGALIGGLVTIPPLGMLVASSVEGQKFNPIDLGPLSDFPEGQFLITTFVEDPNAGEVSRRTAYIRYNGLLVNQPSFTILSNRCAHLGCPVQPNGPIDEKARKEVNGIELRPVLAASFGCPCHGGLYDSEGNRSAGPPVRSLDRFEFSIKDGNLILGRTFSVGHVEGTGAKAQISKYYKAYPGVHVDGVERILYPIPTPGSTG